MDDQYIRLNLKTFSKRCNLQQKLLTALMGQNIDTPFLSYNLTQGMHTRINYATSQDNAIYNSSVWESINQSGYRISISD